MSKELRIRLKNKTLWKFISNTGWILFKEVYSILVSLIVGSLSARYLGPSNYGLISYGGSFISFFLTVSQLGMSNVVILEIVRKPQKEAHYIGSAFIMRLIVSVVSVFIIQAIIVFLEPDNKLLHVVTLLQSLSLIFQASGALYFWFHAKMKMKYATLASMIALTVTSIWRIVLLAKGASIKWFAASSSISALVSCIVISVFFIKKAKIKLRFSINDVKYILKNSYHFIINSVAFTFYTQIDKMMIGKMLNETALGYYTAAGAISAMWEVLPNAFLNSARPLFVQKYDSDKSEFLKRYQFVLLGVTVLGIGIALGFSVFAKFLVWLLYGEDFYPAILVLRILMWATVCSAIGSARTTWMVLNNKGRYMEYFTLIGAAINITLNGVFIFWWGYIGAAWSTLITNVFTGILLPFFFNETKEYAQIYVGCFKRLPMFMEFLKKYLFEKRKVIMDKLGKRE